MFKGSSGFSQIITPLAITFGLLLSVIYFESFSRHLYEISRPRFATVLKRLQRLVSSHRTRQTKFEHVILRYFCV